MTEKTFSELIAPVLAMGWHFSHLAGPINLRKTVRPEWVCVILGPDQLQFAQGFGPTMEIAVIKAVQSAKTDRTPWKPIQINLEDLELDL